MSSDTFEDKTRAEIHRLMREHAAIQNRGYDTARQRKRLRDLIDDHLDQLAGDAEPQHVHPADAAYILSRPIPETFAGMCGLCGDERVGTDALECLACDSPEPSGLGLADQTPDDN